MDRTMTVIKWAVVHGTMTAARFDTFEEAVESAVYCSDAGSEALDCIETAKDGVSLFYDWYAPEVEAIRNRIFDAQLASWKARAAEPRWVVSVRHPTKKRWATVDSLPNQEAAETLVRLLSRSIGADRVKVIVSK